MDPQKTSTFRRVLLWFGIFWALTGNIERVVGWISGALSEDAGGAVSNISRIVDSIPLIGDPTAQIVMVTGGLMMLSISVALWICERKSNRESNVRLSPTKQENSVQKNSNNTKSLASVHKTADDHKRQTLIDLLEESNGITDVISCLKWFAHAGSLLTSIYGDEAEKAAGDWLTSYGTQNGASGSEKFASSETWRLVCIEGLCGYIRGKLSEISGPGSVSRRVVEKTRVVNGAISKIDELIVSNPLKERLNRMEVAKWRDNCVTILQFWLSSDHESEWKYITEHLEFVGDKEKMTADEVRKCVQDVIQHLESLKSRIRESMLK